MAYLEASALDCPDYVGSIVDGKLGDCVKLPFGLVGIPANTTAFRQT